MKVTRKRKLSLSSSSTQSSAAVIAGNDDLLTEILLFLPARSLVRFQSVSTHWKFLISAQSFRRLHLLNHGRRRPETQHSFILGDRCGSQFFICRPTLKKLIRFPITTSYAFRGQHVKILQSCNGLLLIKAKPSHGHGSVSYCVFNPTTMNWKLTINNFKFRHQPVALCLLFDPSKSPYYKVVTFWKKRFDRIIGRIDGFSVYDSATDEWMDGGEFPNVGANLSDGVSCSNRAYFLRTTDPSLYYSPEEKLCTIPCPPKRKGKKYLVESNGYLHCIHLSFKSNRPVFHIAEVIDDKWFACKRAGMCTIDDTTQVELLGMIRAKNILDSTFLVHVPGQIMIYRFDKGCEVLVDYRSDYIYEDDKLQFEFKNVHPFIESFASV